MANYTPEQIEEFLQQFFDVAGTRQYIGARYVPVFGRKDEDSIEWDNTAPYEPLTVVMHNGISYVSKQYVPKGVAIANTDYWAETYRFNAQVEQYRQMVLSYDTRITANTQAIDNEVTNRESSIKSLRDEVSDEYVPFPDGVQHPKFGTLGQVLSTLANGDTEWTDPVVPSDAQATAIINAWLNEHPEATTTVQDNSVTDAKLYAGGVKSRVGNYAYLPRPSNLNDYLDNNKYIVRIDNNNGNSYENWPWFLSPAVGGLLIVVRVTDGAYTNGYQILFDNLSRTNQDMKAAIRGFAITNGTTTFNEWKPFIKTQDGLLDTITDLNSVTYSYSCWITLNVDSPTISNVPVDLHCTDISTLIAYFQCISGHSNTYTIQLLYIPQVNVLYMRNRINGTWEAWQRINAVTHTLEPFTDLDTLTNESNYVLLANNVPDRYPNLPDGFTHASLLEVHEAKGSAQAHYVTQTLTDISTGVRYFRLRNTNTLWTPWRNSLGTATSEIDSKISEDFYKLHLSEIFHTIGVVGDSLASGQGRINSMSQHHDFYDFSWPQCMGRMLDSEVYNFTKSGLTTRTWLTDPMGWALANDGNHHAVCYIIGLGANDINYGAEYVGSISDIHVEDYTLNADTYYGNYGRIISMLRTIEPRSYIFVVTNPVYGSNANVRALLNEAVRTMPTLFDRVYLLDPDVSDYTGTSFIERNKVAGHYTPAAYKYMANYLCNLMDNVIYENPSDFYWVNLVGTTYTDPE